MNLGITLKAAEKVFGPALPGPAEEHNTLSAVRYAKGGSTKYAGISGIQRDAKFYVHFPTSVEWDLLTTKKGTPDYVNDLRESGPQGEQGREMQAAAFLEKSATTRAKIREKQELAAKKAFAAQRKAQLSLLRSHFSHLAGEVEMTLTHGSESFSIPFKIEVGKSGKVKISATL
jgi:hypothetical protein